MYHTIHPTTQPLTALLSSASGELIAEPCPIWFKSFWRTFFSYFFFLIDKILLFAINCQKTLNDFWTYKFLGKAHDIYASPAITIFFHVKRFGLYNLDGVNNNFHDKYQEIDDGYFISTSGHHSMYPYRCGVHNFNVCHKVNFRGTYTTPCCVLNCP